MPTNKGEIRDPICPQKTPGNPHLEARVPEELWMKGVHGNK